MTVEQIDKQIAELKEKKKLELQKKKQKELLAQRQKNAQKRKLESRVKYILGGLVLHHPEIVEQLKKEVARDTDKKTLENYFS